MGLTRDFPFPVMMRGYLSLMSFAVQNISSFEPKYLALELAQPVSANLLIAIAGVRIPGQVVVDED
jgi:hypothetical protein